MLVTYRMTGMVERMSYFGLVLIFLLQSNSVSGLRCYQCTFCEEQDFQYVTCAKALSHFGKAHARKACTTTVIELPEGRVTMKGCGTNYISGCDTVTEEERTETVCSCFSDFCNSSSEQRSVSILMTFSILLSFVHRWLQ